MTGKAVDKSINALEREIKKVVDVAAELKKKEQQCRQEKAGIALCLKNLIGRIGKLADEKG